MHQSGYPEGGQESAPGSRDEIEGTPCAGGFSAEWLRRVRWRGVIEEYHLARGARGQVIARERHGVDGVFGIDQWERLGFGLSGEVGQPEPAVLSAEAEAAEQGALTRP